jgi:hypothetical protein
MNCEEARLSAVSHLSGELEEGEVRRLACHLASCAPCRAESERLDRAWGSLDEGRDPILPPRFREETLARLESETLARRVVRFTRRRWVPLLAEAAALFVAAAAGWFLARGGSGAPNAGGGSPSGETRRPLLATERTIDLDALPHEAAPEPVSMERVTNVALRPVGTDGRVALSFEIPTRYTLVGKPSDGAISALLARVVSGESGTDGDQARAIEAVARKVAGGAPPAPEISEALCRTLAADRNPGVRRKAAEALVSFAPTPAIRDALLGALARDTNPAVRMAAIEGLSKVALALRDRQAIDTLREKASDATESGFVRARAAGALRGLEL